MLEYLQKSTGVFNQNGMIEYEELRQMKLRVQSGEKNLWHGFISFNEENSERIDHPEKCIALVKSVFAEFFRDAGFDPKNMDLMCSLHLDRPHHLHIHYQFWEQEPKIKNERAAGFKYRVKGKIQMSAIDKMTERLNAYTLDDDLARKRDKAVEALFKRSDFSKAKYKDISTRMMRALAEKIPKGASFQYGRKDMIPYRNDVDDIVEMIAATDNTVFWAYDAFREELKKKEKDLQSIMGNYYKERMQKDGIFKENMTDASDEFGVKHIQTIDRLEWDYRRRLGNVVLKKVRFIQDNTYRYDKKKKHKANDKNLKRNISVSNRIIRRSLSDMFSSVLSWFSPQTRTYGNRLKEIEEEMRAEHEREKWQQKKETAVEPPSQKNNSRYNWGKE
jgi:hypothetical protein